MAILTDTDVLFDTWAWVEVLEGGPRGEALWARYGSSPTVRIHTSAITLAELGARLVGRGDDAASANALSHVEGRSRIHALTAEVARASGPLRATLRKTSRNAGLADAMILATARNLGIPLISGDPAFAAQPDVRVR
jgi:predicted nucleic acid-binding protein